MALHDIIKSEVDVHADFMAFPSICDEKFQLTIYLNVVLNISFLAIAIKDGKFPFLFTSPENLSSKFYIGE